MPERKINQQIMGGACRISRTTAYGTNIKTEQKANFPLERKFALTEQTRYTVFTGVSLCSGYGCGDHYMEGDTLLHSWEVLTQLLQSPFTEGILCDIGMYVTLTPSHNYTPTPLTQSCLTPSHNHTPHTPHTITGLSCTRMSVTIAE